MSATNLVTIKRFEALSGYTAGACNAKIDDGIWRIGEVWHKAPDVRRIIDINGYEKWVKGEAENLQRTAGRASHALEQHIAGDAVFAKTLSDRR